MHRDSDATIIERNPSVRKRRTFGSAPYCVLVTAVAMAVAIAAFAGMAKQLKKTGVEKSKYDAILPEPTATARRVFVPEQPVSVKFRHVIFRVGKWEICRFTYEEGEPDNTRESAHE